VPIFAALVNAIGVKFFALLLAMFGAKYAVRLAALTALAALYAAGLVAFSALISPWIGAVFNTQYGQLLGLLFPPVAGTVLAALAAFWSVVIVQKYSATLLKSAAGGG